MALIVLMLKLLRLAPVLPLAFGLLFGQEAANLFDKAPAEIDDALRARITTFYKDFIDGKFRQADALVAEDSKDIFFAAEKKRYKACEIGTIRYSDNFTKAQAVVSCDTQYFMMGREIPVKLPISSLWKVENGQWYWYVLKLSEQQEYNSPFGPVKRPPLPNSDGTAPPSTVAPPRPDPMALAGQVMNAVRVDRDNLEFNTTKASEQEVHVKNSLPGDVTVIATTPVAGLSVKPAKATVHSNQEIKLVVAFNPQDPAITCATCLSHPQDRSAGEVTVRVEPTGRTLPVRVRFVVPHPAAK